MQSEIFNALGESLPSDVLESFINIELLLDRLDFNEHEDQLLEVVNRPEFSTDDLVKEFRAIYKRTLTDILFSYGVLLDQDMDPPIGFLYSFLNVLVMCNYGDAEDVLSVMSERSDDAIEDIVRISEALEGPGYDDIYKYVSDIDDRLLARMSRPSPDENEDADEITNKEILTRFKAYQSANPSNLSYQLIRRRSHVPLSLSSSVLAIKDDLLKLTDRSAMAKEIVALAIASGADYQNLEKVALSVVDQQIYPPTSVFVSGEIKKHIRAISPNLFRS